MTMVNVTVDDFDPLVGYSNYDDWQTPNPQDNPTWFNASSDVTKSPWHEAMRICAVATYHYTTVQGAKATLNFTGTSLTVYGAGGPSGTNYTITLDPSAKSPFFRSFSTANATDGGRTVLYATNQLTNSPHHLEIDNQGSGLLLDLIVVGVGFGADGATLTNTTVQDNDPNVKYSSSWTQQSGPNFNGGTSTYTQGPGNTLSFNFKGSAVYLYGDQVNDHGPYSIYLNGSSMPLATYTGRSGCGGGYAKYCEKLHGLIGFVGSLPEGTHDVTLTNGGPSDGNKTFLDFDYLEYTTPSQYLVQNTTTSDCPFVDCSSTSTGGGTSGSGSGSGSAPSATTSDGAGYMTASSGTSLLAWVMGVWLLRKVVL